MLPTDHACMPVNVSPGKIHANLEHDDQYLCDDVEVDYKHDDITETTILNLLRGRNSPYFPDNKKLNTGPETRLFIYLNGHGGDNFFKI